MDKNLQRAAKFKKVFLYSLLITLGLFLLRLLAIVLVPSLDFGFPLILPLVVIVTLILWIAALIANQAAIKGRNWQSFFVLSLFFPFIMWIVVLVITTDQSQPTSGTKKCPKCAEYVKVEATLCKHCGSTI